jgi:hypothetical protein
MIQIDDSGWGSLLGGVIIGMYNTETRKFKAKIIPVSYFQGSTFKKAKYRDYATKIVLETWPSLGNTNHFQICRGTCLDGIYEMLDHYIKPDYRRIERVEIGDPLQSLLEEKFASSLQRIGVPKRTDGAHCLSFNNQLNWIKENPSRVKYVKTGWDSWNKKYKKECLNGKT